MPKLISRLVVLILILLVIGAYFVKTYNNYNLKNKDDLISFAKVYSGWVYSVFTNVKDITGEVTKKEWLPKNNQTNSS
ncbi:hypothetical protein HYX16_06255 [Candidatus Woesearchaeota archaeon]|nr:hypothetical protein [Candidatus Woesearchaeota archaeon]